MDAPALTPDEIHELARLRARAYGPAADIDSDDDARARLAALEERRAVRPAPASTSASAPQFVRPPATTTWRRPGTGPLEPSAPSERTALPAPAAPGEELDVSADPADAAPEESHEVWRERFAWVRTVPARVWIVAASALLVVAAIAWGVTQLTAPRSDLALSPVDTGDEPPQEFVEQGFYDFYDVDVGSLQQYETFRTLTVWSATNAGGDACLIVVTEQFQYGASAACTPDGLDPIVDFVFWPGLPPEVMGDLPQGTVIRFQLIGGLVHVWTRSPVNPT